MRAVVLSPFRVATVTQVILVAHTLHRVQPDSAGTFSEVGLWHRYAAFIAQLTTYYTSITVAPQVVTYCTPCLLHRVEDLNTTLKGTRAIRQSDWL